MYTTGRGGAGVEANSVNTARPRGLARERGAARGSDAVCPAAGRERASPALPSPAPSVARARVCQHSKSESLRRTVIA